jgi:hypothetical protein
MLALERDVIVAEDRPRWAFVGRAIISRRYIELNASTDVATDREW